jgi:hypothetical protein
MRKWIMLLLALVMVVNLAVLAVGCGGEKKAEKPAPEKAKEEAKPAEAPAPAAPAATPAPAAPEATKK